MNRLNLVLAVATLASVAAAQTPVVTPNPIFARSEGSGTAMYFGAYAAARHQFVDGNHRGSSMTVKELCFRHDDRNYDVMNGMGREWNSVVINMSEGALSSVGSTYSANSVTSPTQVFNSSVSWPIQLGATPFIPAPFAMKFPFSTNWAFSGNRDIVTDFKFSGGKLVNSSAWTGLRPYYLDSFSIGSFANAPATTLGYTNGGCRDSAATSTQGASTTFDSASYGPTMSSSVFRNKYFVRASGKNFAKNAPVMMTLAFLASPDGVWIPGINCNNVHLDLRRTWFFSPSMSNALGEVPPYSFGIAGGLIPYTTAWVGFNLVIQGAWNDSRTNALKLSTASRTSFVAHAYTSRSAIRMKAAYGASATSTTASAVVDGDPSVIPIFCYGK